jgi:hypothetical protein
VILKMRRQMHRFGPPVLDLWPGRFYPQHKEIRERRVTELHHFINGARVAGTSGRFGDVFDPATG